jgi:ribosomal-protein-alanine N-acetyltransferase
MDCTPLPCSAFPALLALERAVFGTDHWSESALSGHLEQAQSISLQIGESAMEGFVLGSYVLDEAELLRIAVSPDQRGQGKGRLLIRSFHHHCTNLGVVRILLEVREDNLPARQLYESEGYSVIAKRRRYYSDGCTAIIYERKQSKSTTNNRA